MADTQNSPPPAPEEDRRGFIAGVAAIVIGGIVSLGPLVIGLIPFFDPFRKKRVPERYAKEGGADEGFLYVTTLDTIPENGLPARFVVIADKTDAWNFVPDQPIGSVYLSRQGDGSVLAFNTTCPHAGCSVAYEAQSDAFLCPCHNSSFATDGSRRKQTTKENPSPRDLDQLDVSQERLAASGEIWVAFKNYYTGREHMEEKP